MLTVELCAENERLRQQLAEAKAELCADVEAKLQAIIAVMQQWRTLAEQMTEERDRVTLLWESAVIYSVSLQNQREALKTAVREIAREEAGLRQLRTQEAHMLAKAIIRLEKAETRAMVAERRVAKLEREDDTNTEMAVRVAGERD